MSKKKKGKRNGRSLIDETKKTTIEFVECGQEFVEYGQEYFNGNNRNAKKKKSKEDLETRNIV